MHLEWEQRLFRRTYINKEGKTLPLYEGYACIWASDNLQYNGGGAAHSTAYNYYANRSAAEVARWIGEDASPYQRESDLIREGMRELLWLPQSGTFGESKDILEPQSVYANPALWSSYHTIDSEVPSPLEAWQILTEQLARLKRVPIHGEGVPEGKWFMLSCSDWLPYVWSLNLLLLAENMHMALALWQAGMVEEAFQVFKGNLIDSMFQGLAPGNFHMTSELDVHRQEAQRDFGDPIGITSRALVEGLYGIKPNLLNGVVTIRPGFPDVWNDAALHHSDITLNWRRSGEHETFEISSNFARPVRLVLQLRAPRTGRPSIHINGAPSSGAFMPESVGSPLYAVSAPEGSKWKVEVEWRGDRIEPLPQHRSYELGQEIELPHQVSLSALNDPQHCLTEGRTSLPGAHTIFARMQQGECQWWFPISFETSSRPIRKPERLMVDASSTEMLDLAGIFQHQITDIFKREYAAPRSSFCSLSIPIQGAGAWAAFDVQPEIDDTGLRFAGGVLKTSLGIPFRLPVEKNAPNCRFLSFWKQDQPSIEVPLSGKAQSLFLLMAGSTFPQCSRMTHAVVRVHYIDGSESVLELRNPETWWPIEQDYLLDDYLFVNTHPIPPRVDLRSGQTRVLDTVTFRGKGGMVKGGAANLLEVPLDRGKSLSSVQIEVKLYGIVVALLAATLLR
jgi:hypothetical protein